MLVVDDLTKAQVGHETVLTVGAFDGLHVGHQALMTAVVERAEDTDRLAAVVTFHPHPAAILAPEREPRYLTTPSERVALLEMLGVDLVALLPFTQQLAATPARDFVARIVDNLRAREIWIGPDFALGRSREGDAAHLRDMSRALGFVLRVVQPAAVQVEEPMPSLGLLQEGAGAATLVSSSRIREYLGAGRVADASRLLGRYYSLAGRAVPAPDQGRSPVPFDVTMEVPRERAVPAAGMYAVHVTVNTDRVPGVAVVRVVPGFGGAAYTIGVHMLDHDGDISGCGLVVEFVERLGDTLQSGDADPATDHSVQVLADARRILDSQRRLPSLARLGLGRLEWSGTRSSYRYREIEHTADRALQVWGAELAGLFASAARGMYSLMADIDGLVATTWQEVSVAGLDYETLLVDWLNELLFLTESEGLLFVDYEITEVTERSLVARAGGAPGEVTQADIKAATFHNLAVVLGEGGWTTVVTFDV